MGNQTLDEIIKECCKFCGCYRCQNHLDWQKCNTDGCISTWDSEIFLGCPVCLAKDGKRVYRPRLKESCCLCGHALKDGSVAYTDSTPAGTFCGLCATVHKIAFWTITVKIRRIWTGEEIMAERQRAAGHV